tara:strand:+ start:3314 stop:4882 length:1569 start_codon:yes stop_codon:yes gene_type:complete
MTSSVIIWILILAIITLIIIGLVKYIKNFQNAVLYNALEQTKINGVLLSKDNKITRITDSTCELLEIERFEIIGKHVSYLFDHKDKYQITLILKNLEEYQFDVIDNITIKTKTGHCHVLCKLSRVDSVFKFHHKMLVLQDRTNIISYIKKIEKSEKQLKEYSNLFRSSFEDSFLPSVIVRKDGMVTNYNKSFHSLLRRSLISLNKDSLFDLLNIDKYSFTEELKKKHSFEMTGEIRGQKRSLVFNIHEITASEGKEFILCQIQDISRQKQSEELRKKLEKQIKQSRKVEYLGELASVISHEFNNALMPIISFTNSVEKSLPEEYEKEKDKLRKVITASDHAKQMINQIMAIKHIDFHEKEAVDLNELIERNLPKFNLPESIKLKINNPVERPMTYGNYDVLGTAMQNVVHNSIQALNNKEGEIIFDLEEVIYKNHPPKSFNNHSIKTNRKYIRFAICDNGSGIKQDDIGTIFNPFFTTKHFNKQIGTGLTYVYNCMDKYGIPLTLENKDDGGVSITAFFPKA